jgi:hypothetical protein
MPPRSSPLLTQIGDRYGSRHRSSRCEFQAAVKSGEMGVTITLAGCSVHGRTGRRCALSKIIRRSQATIKSRSRTIPAGHIPSAMIPC